MINQLRIFHRPKHEGGARQRGFGGCFRIVMRRRFDDARQHGRLGQREFFGGLVEIALRGRFDAVDAGAEVNPIEIEAEDLVLAVTALQIDRENGLFDLAP